MPPGRPPAFDIVRPQVENPFREEDDVLGNFLHRQDHPSWSRIDYDDHSPKESDEIFQEEDTDEAAVKKLTNYMDKAKASKLPLWEWYPFGAEDLCLILPFQVRAWYRFWFWFFFGSKFVYVGKFYQKK